MKFLMDIILSHADSTEATKQAKQQPVKRVKAVYAYSKASKYHISYYF